MSLTKPGAADQPTGGAPLGPAPSTGRRGLTTAAAAARVGLTAEQFRRLAERLDLPAVATYRNPYGPGRCPIWDADAVEALVGGAEVEAVRRRSEKLRLGRERAAAERKAKDEAGRAARQEEARRRSREGVERRNAARAELGLQPGVNAQEVLAGLADDRLLDLALRSLQALNRRAKHYRKQGNGLDEPIYSAKTAMLDALVRAGRASVFWFSWMRARRGWECEFCGRTWGGESDWCVICHEHSGREPYESYERWYVVQIGDYRWHQPPATVTPAMVRAATPTEAHDRTGGSGNSDQPRSGNSDHLGRGRR